MGEREKVLSKFTLSTKMIFRGLFWSVRPFAIQAVRRSFFLEVGESSSKKPRTKTIPLPPPMRPPLKEKGGKDEEGGRREEPEERKKKAFFFPPSEQANCKASKGEGHERAWGGGGGERLSHSHFPLTTCIV